MVIISMPDLILREFASFAFVVELIGNIAGSWQSQTNKEENESVDANFQGLGLSDWLQTVCRGMGMSKPTQVRDEEGRVSSYIEEAG